MQLVSDLFKELLEGDYRVETRLSVNDAAPDDSYGEDILISMSTSRKVFPQELPTVGGCVAGELSLEIREPPEAIPRQAKLIPYVRLWSLDGSRCSEWVQKGVFYIDTRKKKEDNSGIIKYSIQGYDDILKTEQDYTDSELTWPAMDEEVVWEIAKRIGVKIDRRTLDIITNEYQVDDVTGYTYREVLGYIAAMYGGNFIMSDEGLLLLVAMGNVSADDSVETNYLIDENGNILTFGGDRILV